MSAAPASSPRSLNVFVSVLRTPSEKAFLLEKAASAQDIAFFEADMVHQRSYLAAQRDGLLVGVVAFTETSAYTPGALGISFVSVAHTAKNQGIAALLVTALFELAERERKPLALTPYEPEGLRYLKPLVQRAKRAHPRVQVVERP